MSTQGAILVPVPGNAAIGRYHHSDGYPTGLGMALFNAYQSSFKNLADMVEEMIFEHPAGWSQIVGKNWSGEGENGPECYCHAEYKGDPLDSRDSQHENHALLCRDKGAGICMGAQNDCAPDHIVWAYRITDLGLEVWKSVPESGSRAHKRVEFLDWKMGGQDAQRVLATVQALSGSGE